MSALLFVIGLALAGQVGVADDRYPTGGQTGSASQSDRTATDQGIVPLIESPPAAEGTTGGTGRPGGGLGDPYSQQSQPAAGQRSYPGGVSPPPGVNRFQGLPESQSVQAPPAQAGSGPKPTKMIRDMLKPPASSQLLGESVPLVDVLAGARSRLEQTLRVEAYWDLCSSVADYYLGLREQEELRRLQSVAGGTGTAWQQAESELAVRMDTSLRAARASQWRVAAWLNRGASRLPLPEDVPHCGSYHARYSEVFAGRPSAEGQELAELLPLRYAELKGAATAVARAEEFAGSVARSDKSGGTGTLRALEFAALRRRAFVQIARDYNRRIARYTELAFPGEIGTERLIGMLIKPETSSTATRPTLPGATGRQSNSIRDNPPRTFANAEGWEAAGDRSGEISRDSAVQPASGVAPQGPRRERSLLVSPQ